MYRDSEYRVCELLSPPGTRRSGIRTETAWYTRIWCNCYAIARGSEVVPDRHGRLALRNEVCDQAGRSGMSVADRRMGYAGTRYAGGEFGGRVVCRGRGRGRGIVGLISVRAGIDAIV